MKKIYLSLGCLALTGMVMAQVQQASSQMQTASADKSTSTINRSTTSIAYGTYSLNEKIVFLSEDFEAITAPALPTGWTATTNATGGYTGYYTGDEVAANTGGFWPVPNNGSTNFVMTNDDVANDLLDAERLILPSIDLTGQTGIGLSFDVFNDANYGSGSGIVEISTNGGTSWTPILTIPVDAANWQHIVIDLAAYDNTAGVIISFFWNDGGTGGTAGDNWGTGLAVDNIIVETVPADEITANYVINADINQDFEYTILPLTQARPIAFTFEVSNNGFNNQPDVNLSYDISFGGSSVGSGTGTALPIASFAVDTLFATSTYTPTAVGTYSLTATATMAATEVNTTDNIKTMDMDVSNFIWARDATIFDGSFRNVSGANGAGVKIGHLFLATTDQVFYSINIGIANSTLHDGKIFFGEIYYFDAATSSYLYLDGTIEHTINNAIDGGNILSLPLLSGGQNITAGMQLLVVAGHYGGAADASDHVRFATAGVARQGTVLGFDGSGTLFNLTSPPALVVRLNAENGTGIDEVAENSMTLSQNMPNPFNTTSRINYSVKSNANVNLTVVDMTGKVVMVINEGTKAAGDYTITLDASELAGGMYFYTLSNGETSITKTMSVVK